LAAVSPVGRASGLEPLSPHADALTVEALYQQHSRSVFAFCLSRLGRREDAEDAVQTTFLHAVRGLRRGVVPNVELAWLLGIAKNVCLSRRESAGRRGRLELVCDPVDLERAPAHLGRGDELIGLREALARLPERQRQAVLLRDWRGLSYEEVAQQLGVSLANAESLIFRGRTALAELLDEQPAATRRRLAALGNLGSIAAWIKSALTGASLAAKVVAAATTVAAVSATGIAVGTSAPERPAKAPAGRATPGTGPIAPGTAPNADGTAARPADAGPSAPSAAPPQTRAAGRPTPSVPTRADSRPAPVAAAPAPPAAAPVAAAPRAPAKPTVQSTVDKATAPLPGTVPQLPEPLGSLPAPPLPPVVEPVVEAVAPVVEPVVAAVAPVSGSLPAVTVTPPPVLPLQPITVDPKQLLP
jgi:RNA polymerase sigma-70 factor, ECF subfamily